MKKPKKLSSKRKILIGAIVVASIAGLSVYYFTAVKDNSQHNKPTPNQPQNDTDSTETKQNDIDRENSADEDNQSQKKTIKPVITNANQYDSTVEVNGYVNLFEDGGTCTATFTQGTNTFSRSTSAVKSSQSTVCPTISVSVNEFPSKGEWNVALKYSSGTSEGTSDSRTFEVK